MQGSRFYNLHKINRHLTALTLLLALVVVALSAPGCTQSDPNAPDPDKVQSRTATTSTPTTSVAQEQRAQVTRVIDGDTIEVILSGRKYRVRLIGIDTPERGRPYYREATNKTKELVLAKQVRLVKDVSETDRYGRLLRYVYVNGTFVNAELVRQGYAVQATFPPDVRHAELFKRLAAEAREEEAGLWKTGR